jgi:hypothetical protein
VSSAQPNLIVSDVIRECEIRDDRTRNPFSFSLLKPVVEEWRVQTVEGRMEEGGGGIVFAPWS